MSTGPAASRPAVAIVGKLIVDEVLTVEHPPLPGSQQRATRREVTGGGQVWHTARALARLGHAVTATGVCGNDLDTRRIVAALEDAGVRARFATLTGSLRTVVLQQTGGERTIVSAPTARPGVVGEWDPAALLSEPVANGSDTVAWLHLDGFVLDAYGRTVAQGLVEAARDRGLPLSMEAPSLAGLPRRRDALAALPRLDLLVGRSDEVAAVRDALVEQPRAIATHDGPDPVRLQRGRDTVTVPVPPVTVRTLGAGDRFTAGLLAVLVVGGTDGEALASGIRAAQRGS